MMTDQFLCFASAKQLAKAKILFPDCVIRYYWDGDRYMIRLKDNLFLDSEYGERDIEKFDEDEVSIAAPTLEELIEKLPEIIEVDAPVNYHFPVITYYNEMYILNKRLTIRYSTVSQEQIAIVADEDPKIACAQMLLKLNELGLLPTE